MGFSSLSYVVLRGFSSSYLWDYLPWIMGSSWNEYGRWAHQTFAPCRKQVLSAPRSQRYGCECKCECEFWRAPKKKPSRFKFSISLEKFNLAWNVQSCPSEFPTIKIGLWRAARLKFQPCLKLSIPEGDLEFFSIFVGCTRRGSYSARGRVSAF